MRFDAIADCIPRSMLGVFRAVLLPMFRLSYSFVILSCLGSSAFAQTTAPAPTPAPAPNFDASPPVGMTLVLPTDNDALFRNDGPAFYMFVDRDFEKVKSTPWEGGQFGFVRGPVRLGGQVIQM